jgi:hypothetical protein
MGELSAPFIVFALPRSRTAWVARFLSYDGWVCHHEHAMFVRAPADIARFFATPRTGSAETAAGPAWPLLRHYVPQARFAVIRRPAGDAAQAMIAAWAAAGISYQEDEVRRLMSYGARCLDRIAALPGTLSVNYADLAGEAACRQLFEFCVPYRFDREWWRRWAVENVQVDLAEFFASYLRHRDDIEALKRSLKRELIRLCRIGEIDHGAFH